MTETVEKLYREQAALIEYLKAKTEAKDWHGCQDAASDLRDIECMIEVHELYEKPAR